MLARYIAKSDTGDELIDEVEVENEEEAVALVGSYLVLVRDLEWFDSPFSVRVEI